MRRKGSGRLLAGVGDWHHWHAPDGLSARAATRLGCTQAGAEMLGIVVVWPMLATYYRFDLVGSSQVRPQTGARSDTLKELPMSQSNYPNAVVSSVGYFQSFFAPFR